MASKRFVGFLGTPSKTSKINPIDIIKRSFAYDKNKPIVSESAKEVIHTGQVFADDDIRNTRFVDRVKEVNRNWAIKLIAEVPPAPAKERIVACDGGGGPLGHPKVYINLDKPGNHICGYCGLRFFKEDHH